MERVIKVDEARCLKCGWCVRDCASFALRMNSRRIPEYKEDGAEMCHECQHCMAICPAGAISIGGLNPDNSELSGYGNSADLLKLIKSRRSFRHYKYESVPPEKIEKIKEMLAYPPTGVNFQGLHYSVVGTKEKMDEIRSLSYKKLYGVDGDLPVIKQILKMYQGGQDVIFRNATSMVVVCVDENMVAPDCEMIDPIIAMSYLELYAQSLELGTLWNHQAVRLFKLVPDVVPLLKIPEGYKIAYVMLLGVPAVKYKRTVQKEVSSFTII